MEVPLRYERADDFMRNIEARRKAALDAAIATLKGDILGTPSQRVQRAVDRSQNASSFPATFTGLVLAVIIAQKARVVPSLRYRVQNA